MISITVLQDILRESFILKTCKQGMTKLIGNAGNVCQLGNILY